VRTRTPTFTSQKTQLPRHTMIMPAAVAACAGDAGINLPKARIVHESRDECQQTAWTFAGARDRPYSAGVGEASSATYTVVSCHFGDPFWITHTLNQIDALSDDRIASVVLVDQSRKSADYLTTLPRVGQVLTFPPDLDQISWMAHDHPASLNRAMAAIDFTTSHVLVLDSDCFPIDASWLDRLSNATMASDPFYGSLSHPCLMAFPAEVAPKLDFAEGIREIGIDTGRLVALQITKAGTPVTFTRPAVAFSGYRGHFYLDRSVYHHGSASFMAADDERLTRQVSPQREMRYRSYIEAGQFELPRREWLSLKWDGLKRRLARR